MLGLTAESRYSAACLPGIFGTAADAAKITDQLRRATPEIDDAVRHAPRQPSGTSPGPRPAPPATVPPAVPPSPAPPVTVPPATVPPPETPKQ